MQGYPLAVVTYDIRILPLIKRLKSTYPDATQTWYANNYGSLGTFDNLEQYFNLLKRNGPDQGYNLDPTKIILIVHPNNIKAGGVFGQFHEFKVYMIARYLGGYIRDDKYKVDWIKNWIDK